MLHRNQRPRTLRHPTMHRVFGTAPLDGGHGRETVPVASAQVPLVDVGDTVGVGVYLLPRVDAAVVAVAGAEQDGGEQGGGSDPTSTPTLTWSSCSVPSRRPGRR